MERNKLNKKWLIDKEKVNNKTKEKSQQQKFSPNKTIHAIAIALLIFIASFAVLASNVSAANNLLALQGSAINNGIAINNGNLVVTIYDAPSGGTLIYNSGTDYNNAVNNGRFDVMIGDSSQQLTLEYGKIYYMDMSINGQDLTFDGNDRRAFQSSVGNITANYIAQNSITSAKISDGTIVDADINDIASINKSKISSTGKWNEEDIPTLSSLWTGTIDYTKIFGASNLYVNNSQYLGGYLASVFFSNDSTLANKINAVNTTTNIQLLGFNTTTQLTTLYNTLYNDTTAINNKANAANCPTGQVVQNTTATGVECIVPTSNSYTNGSGLDLSGNSFAVNNNYIQQFNDTTAINLKLNANDQRYNDTTAINNKLDATDQRYNETTQINNLLTNDTNLANKINSVNSSTNIKSFGFNLSTELKTWFDTLYVSTGISTLTNFYNKTDIDNKGFLNATNYTTLNNKIDNVNSSLQTEISARTSLGNWSADKINYNKTTELYNQFLNLTDQRFNETSKVNAVNTTTNIQLLGFNTTTQLTTLYNTLYNDTTAINAKSTPGTCGVNQFVQNTTTGGVQCASPSAGAETDPVFTAQNASIWSNISVKLNITDQRYNETTQINSVNSSLQTEISARTSLGNWSNEKTNYYNKTDIDNKPYLNATNYTTLNNKIDAINSTTNIKGFGFNFTSELKTYFDSLYYGISNSLGFINQTQADARYLQLTDQKYNETGLLNSLNSSLQTEISARTSLGNWSADKLTYATNTAVTNNYTALDNKISSIGNWTLDKTNYNTTTQLKTIFVNQSIIANCPAGQVVQNTTANGVQCITPTAVASPLGSSNGAIQFNNNSVMAGSVAADITPEGYLSINNASEPPIPTSGVTLFAEDRGEETSFAWIGNSGYDKYTQPHVFYEDVAWVQSSHNNSIPVGIGMSIGGMIGTASYPNKNFSNFRDTLSWTVLTSANNNYAELRSGGLQWGRGNSSLSVKNGGYKLGMRYYVGFADNQTVGCFGMFNNTASYNNISNCFTSTNSSNALFVGFNSTQKTLRYWTSNSTTINMSYDCGSDFPIGNTTNSSYAVYETTIFVKQSGNGVKGNVSFYTKRLDNSSISPCVYTINGGEIRLQSEGVPVSWKMFLGRNGAPGVAGGILGFNKLYVSTDN